MLRNKNHINNVFSSQCLSQDESLQTSHGFQIKMQDAAPYIKDASIRIRSILEQDNVNRTKFCKILQEISKNITNNITSTKVIIDFLRCIRNEITDCMEYVYSKFVSYQLNNQDEFVSLKYQFSDDTLKMIIEPFRDEMVSMLRFIQEEIDSVLSSNSLKFSSQKEQLDIMIDQLRDIDKTILNCYIGPISSYISNSQLSKYLISASDILMNISSNIQSLYLYKKQHNTFFSSLTIFMNNKYSEEEKDDILAQEEMYLESSKNKLKLSVDESVHLQRSLSILEKTNSHLRENLMDSIKKAENLDIDAQFNSLLKPNEINALETYNNFNLFLIESAQKKNEQT